jgi:hypothetical protein
MAIETFMSASIRVVQTLEFNVLICFSERHGFCFGVSILAMGIGVRVPGVDQGLRA